MTSPDASRIDEPLAAQITKAVVGVFRDLPNFSAGRLLAQALGSSAWELWLAGFAPPLISELLGPRLMWRGLKPRAGGRRLAGQDNRAPSAGRRRPRRRPRRVDPVGAHESRRWRHPVERRGDRGGTGSRC